MPLPYGPRDVSYLKPKRFQDYVTINELSKLVKKDISWLRYLERVGRIPKASRVKRGQLEVRLWSPRQVEEIKAILATHQVGRPRSE